MQEIRTGRGEDPIGSGKNSGHWVHEDPHNVMARITVPGMACPIGWVNGLVVVPGIESPLPNGETLPWDYIHVEELRLSHPSHMAIIEGVATTWLFMGGHIEGVGEEHAGINVQGPLMLLRMDPPPLYAVPYTLKDVVFGRPGKIPEGLKMPDVLSSMLYTLLSQPIP